MDYLFWIFIGAIGAVTIWWLMDWHDKNSG
jgi:hypothetical protein